MDQIVIQVIVQAVLFLYPAWRIYGKAGLNPAISLTVLIPGLGVIICAVILAVSNWNVQSVGGE